jgi:hypothetical protein
MPSVQFTVYFCAVRSLQRRFSVLALALNFRTGRNCPITKFQSYMERVLICNYNTV